MHEIAEGHDEFDPLLGRQNGLLARIGFDRFVQTSEDPYYFLHLSQCTPHVLAARTLSFL